jgi:hypothetical protein
MKKKMKTLLNKNAVLFLLVLSICLIPKFVVAASFDDISALGNSARTIGLGNINGFSNSSSVVFENPAGLFRVGQNSISAFATTLMNEAHYNNIALSTATPFGNFAVGYMAVSVFDMPITAEANTAEKEYLAVDSWDYNNSIVKVAYQFSVISDLYFGLSYNKYLHRLHDQNVPIEGSGDGFDLGMIWDTEFVDFSFVARNILPASVKYNDTDNSEEPLSRELSGAAMYQYEDLSLYGQVRYKWRKFLPAVAVSYRPFFMPIIQVNGGYKQRIEATSTGHKKSNGYTMGLGLYLYDLQVHYAFEKCDHPEYDNKSYISLSLNF